MRLSEKLRLYAKGVAFLISHAIREQWHRLCAWCHRKTYTALPSAKRVIVIGGSFAGIRLAERLAETLPTGYRVSLIERRSRFNYSFVFPRFSVTPGREHLAFIPYDGMVEAKGAPPGIFDRITDSVVDITEDLDAVMTASGQRIEFSYLAIATGAAQLPPAQVTSFNHEEGCLELQAIQKCVRGASRIAVVGGGAVGIEIATDIKDYFPQKEVTLFHSRERLLPSFGRRLHEYVVGALKKMDIRLVLGQRPESVGKNHLRLADGAIEDFDLIVSFLLLL